MDVRYIPPHCGYTHTHTQALYTSTHSDFLLDEGDTVAAYERKAQSRPSSHDAGMAALSTVLDRTQQVEMFHREYIGKGCG